MARKASASPLRKLMSPALSTHVRRASRPLRMVRKDLQRERCEEVPARCESRRFDDASVFVGPWRITCLVITDPAGQFRVPHSMPVL